MTTLHDRLADLAGDAPAGRPAPELWDRGLRYRRRRRTGTAVVLVIAAVALIALGSVTWLRSPAAVAPLPADSPPAVPDRLYAPSPWLPGTADAGPLGTIAALIPASRGRWTGTEEGQVVGVSATTGEYRFVDLPGLAPHSGLMRPYALSPDGRWVAYLYREAGSRTPDGVATGLALYEAGTGQVRRQALPESLGISGDQLEWAGPDAVVLWYGSIQDRSGEMSLGRPLEVWNVHVDRPSALSTSRATDELLAAGPGFVVLHGRSTDRVVDVGTGVVLRRMSEGSQGITSPVFDRRANRFAVMAGDRIPGAMSVGRVGATVDDPPSYVQVPGSERAFAAYGWIDDDHVAVLQRPDTDPMSTEVVVDKVDVTTGETSRLVEFDGPDLGFDRQLATDLLSRPTARAVKPPDPVDPRKVTGLAAGVILAGGAVLVMWRRRVRP
jgi:hypothetical protein